MSNGGEGVFDRQPLGPLPEITGWVPWPEPQVRATTGSTMVDVEELAAHGAPEGTVVVAEEQTSGRGRRGRHWESARYSGLWLSLLLRPDRPADQVGWLPLVVGIGVARGLRSVTGLPVALKWPNDAVIVDGGGVRKIAGVLAERLASGAVVVGVGINVDHIADELPEGGTSLRLEGAPVAREVALAAVLSEVASAYRLWLGGQDMAEDYADLSATLGARVRVRLPGGDAVGTAHGLGSAGELILMRDEGMEQVITAGDVVHLRPADD